MTDYMVTEKHERVAITRVPLDPKYKAAWDETRAALVVNIPALTHVFYSLMTPTDGEYMAVFTDHPAIPVAATDGYNVILNPAKYFTEYDLDERVFILCHEILHAVWNHCGLGHIWRTQGYLGYSDGKHYDYHHDLMNIAMDMVINDMLVQSDFGKMPKNACHDTSIGKATDSVMDVYRTLYDMQARVLARCPVLARASTCCWSRVRLMVATPVPRLSSVTSASGRPRCKLASSQRVCRASCRRL